MIKYEHDNIILDSNPRNNYIQIDFKDYQLEYLKTPEPFKGASSNLFLLIDPNKEFEVRVIKICKTPLDYGKTKRHSRFLREIRAFKLANNKKLPNVIRYHNSGEVEIDDLCFLYIIMEKAQEDLTSYLERNKFNFTTNQKLSFCINILNGVKQLHSLKIYHRDIKNDNILRVNGEFKLGDLGIAKFQNEDNIDKVNEKIGPYGWLSPEATNKMLTYKKSIGKFSYDCDINYKSDIFQLGKLFWYIFQGNLPIGQLIPNDYKFEEDIYNVIILMLQYEKKRRPNIDEIEALFEPLKVKYAV